MYACLVDGSKKSLKALELAIRMLGPNDRIHTISAAQPNICVEKLQLTVEQILEENGVLDRSEVQILNSNPGEKVSETIRSYLVASIDKDYIDIIFLGNQGADFSTNDKSKYLGSVADSIICHTKINTAFVC